jgi:hypothetical protein
VDFMLKNPGSPWKIAFTMADAKDCVARGEDSFMLAGASSVMLLDGTAPAGEYRVCISTDSGVTWHLQPALIRVSTFSLRALFLTLHWCAPAPASLIMRTFLIIYRCTCVVAVQYAYPGGAPSGMPIDLILYGIETTTETWTIAATNSSQHTA